MGLVKRKIKPEQLEQSAPITEILSQANGGLPAVLRAIRFSDDPLIEQFLEQYDKSTYSEKPVLPWEVHCINGNINAKQLLGAIMVAIRSDSITCVSILAMTNHADVMKARIREAKKPHGVKDRDAIDVGLKFLPANKGATIIGKLVVNEGESGADDAIDADVNVVFPNLAETQKMLGSGS